MYLHVEPSYQRAVFIMCCLYVNITAAGSPYDGETFQDITPVEVICVCVWEREMLFDFLLLFYTISVSTT